MESVLQQGAYGSRARCGSLHFRLRDDWTLWNNRSGGRSREQRGTLRGKEDRGRSEGRWRKFKLNPNGLVTHIRLSSQQLRSRHGGSDQAEHLCRCARAANTLVHVHPLLPPEPSMPSTNPTSTKGGVMPSGALDQASPTVLMGPGRGVERGVRRDW